MSKTKIAILGGGIAGLSAAFTAARAGCEVTVFEETDTLGGQVAYEKLGGIEFDTGAESFSLRNPEMLKLLDTLGLTEKLVYPNQNKIWIAGTNIPNFVMTLPQGGVLGIPTSLSDPDMISILGLKGTFRAYLDYLLPKSFGLKSRKTNQYKNLSEVIAFRLGKKVAQRVCAPILEGVYQSQITWDKIDTFVPGFANAYNRTHSLVKASRQMNEIRSKTVSPGGYVGGLKGGNHLIITTLVSKLQSLGVKIVLNATRLSFKSEVDNWEIKNSEEVHKFNKLIIATSAQGAVKVLQNIGYPNALLIKSKPESDINVISLLIKSPELDNFPRGNGVLATQLKLSTNPDINLKAITHSNAKWSWLDEELKIINGPHHHIVRVYTDAKLELKKPGDLEASLLPVLTKIYGVTLVDFEVKAYNQRYWSRFSLVKDGVSNTKKALVEELKGFLCLKTNIGFAGSWVSQVGLSSAVPDAIVTVKKLLNEGS